MIEEKIISMKRGVASGHEVVLDSSLSSRYIMLIIMLIMMLIVSSVNSQIVEANANAAANTSLNLPSLELNKGYYSVDDTVYISIVGLTNDPSIDDSLSLEMTMQSDASYSLRYLGAVQQSMVYIPKKTGNYSARLYRSSGDDQILLSQKSFTVYDSESSDCKSAPLGQPILIDFTKYPDYRYKVPSSLMIIADYGISDATSPATQSETFVYSQTITSVLTYNPSKSGRYTLFADDGYLECYLVYDTSGSSATEGSSTESSMEPSNLTLYVDASGNVSSKRLLLRDSSGVSKLSSIQLHNVQKIGGIIRSTSSYGVSSNMNSLYDNNSVDTSGLLKENTLGTTAEVADYAVVDLSNATGMQGAVLKMDNLTLGSQDITMNIERVHNPKIHLDTGDAVDSFAMDLSNLNFTNGTFSKVASGSELWKCRDWNFTTQVCFGSWIKLMDIVPGQEYNFTVSASDPGYAEILISRALHLDENRSFISDVFSSVSALDDVWSEPVYSGQYLRVSFEKNLTSVNDITVYVRNNQSSFGMNTSIDVYYPGTSILITSFPVISSAGYYKIYLTNMFGFYDTFDLRVVDPSNDPRAFLEFDYIVDPPWANSSFDRCRNITLNNSVGSVLVNFPVYVNLSYDSDMLPNYADLRFYNASCNNGGSLLNYEVENFTSSKADVWVRVPSLVSGVNVISVYYDNNTAVSSGQNRTGVWDNSYVMVQHLEERSGTHYDSTRYGNNVTATVTVQGSAVGIVDGADNYVRTSSNDAIVAYSTSLDINTYTIEAWTQLASVGTSRGILGTRFGGENTFDLKWEAASLHGDIGSGSAWLSTAADYTYTPVASTWYHVVYVVYTNGYQIYLNGNLAVSGSYTGIPELMKSGETMHLGSSYTTEYFDGILDEVRISNVARNSSWINQTYKFISNQSRYVTLGTEQSRGITTPQVNLSYPSNNYVNDTSNFVNLTFNATILGDNGLVNCSLWTNISGSWVLNQTQTIGGVSNVTYFNLSNQSSRIFIWNIQCYDTVSNIGWASANRTVILNWTDTIPPSPFNLSLPLNATQSQNLTPNLTWQQTTELYFANYTVLLSKDPAFASIDFTYYTSQISNVSYKITTPLDANSIYYWRVVAYDNSRNSRNSTNDFTYITDTLAPTINLNIPVDNGYVSTSSVVFNYTPNDANTLSTCVLYGNFSGAWTSNVSNSSVIKNGQNYFTITLSEGIYLWNVRCNDSAGNFGFASSNKTVRVDLTSPVITLITPTNNTYQNVTNNLNFSARAADWMSNVSSCKLIINDVVAQAKNDIINNQSFNFTTELVLNGNYNWSVNCTNMAGLEGSSIRYNLTVEVLDRDPPVIILNYPLSNSFISSSNISFNYTPEDATGLRNCSAYIDGKFNATNTSADPLVNFVPNYFNVSGFSEGKHNWSIVCVDNTSLYNVGSSAVRNLTIDLTDPHVILNLPAVNAFSSSASVTFHYTPSDTNLQACVLYGNFTGLWSPVSLNSSPANGQDNTFMQTLSDGIYLWNVRCNDSSGRNVFASSNYLVKVDTTFPGYLSIFTDPSSPTIYAPVRTYSFNVTWMDNFGVDSSFIENNFTGTLINQTTTAVGGIYTFTVQNLAAGNYSYRWYANDSAGNVNSTGQFIYAVQKAPSSISLYLNGTHGNYSINESDTVNITAVITVPSSGNAEIYIDGNIIASGSSSLTNISRFMAPAVYNITAVYPSTQNYSASSESFLLTVRDLTPPVINLTYPGNAATVGTDNVVFQYFVNDSSILKNCSLYINGTLNQTSTNVEPNSGAQFSVSMGDGNYTWQVRCYDLYDNFNQSQTRTLNVFSFATLNSTTPYNFSSDNITCNYDFGGSATSSAVAWYKNNSPAMILYLPMEGNSTNALVDRSGMDNNVVNFNAVLWNSTAGFDGKGAFMFDGTARYLNISTINVSSGAWTFVSWVKTTSGGIIYNSRTATSTGIVVTVRNGNEGYSSCAASNGLICFGIDGAGVYAGRMSTVAINDGKWHYVVASATNIDDYNSFNIFIDGVNVTGTSAVAAVGIITATGMRIGYSTEWPSVPFNGTIDELRMYNRSLSSDQIWALYQNKTNVMVSSELTPGDIWQCRATSFSSTAVGSIKTSNNLTILAGPFTFLDTPYDGSYINTRDVAFICNSTDDWMLKNITLYWNYTGSWLPNRTTDIAGRMNQTTFQMTALSDGIIQWNCQACDNESNCLFASQNFTVKIDTIIPTISLIPPSDTNGAFITRNLTFINVSVSENVVSCVLNWSGALYDMLNASASQWDYNMSIYSAGEYNYSVYCTDYANNTGYSKNMTIRYYSDISIGNTDILFSKNSPVENETIIINATIRNYHNVTYDNVLARFYVGDPDSGGVQIGQDKYINITQFQNTTINISWTVPVGIHIIYVKADPLNAIPETDKTNNKAYNFIGVSVWQIYYGDVTASNQLGSSSNSTDKVVINWSTKYYPDMNIYVVPSSESVNWLALQAITRNTTGGMASDTSDDFNDMDISLGTENFTDSINRTYSVDGLPNITSNYTLFNQPVNNVPEAVSTNNANFHTGILWDTSDSASTHYSYQSDPALRADLVFVTRVNYNKTGAYGLYDYEMRVPAFLRSYKGAGETIVFYYEVK